MRKAGKVFAVAVLTALAATVAPVAEAQPPIRICVTLSQTGVYATSGQNQLRGYQLCVKHMNEKGGVLGRKLELVVYDDASDPATAVRLYEQLITRDKGDLVLGPFSGFIADPVADVTEKHKMPMMAPVAALTSSGRLARGTGAGEAALPDAAVEPAPVSKVGKVFAAAVLAALTWAVAPVAEAQPPIRVVASLSLTVEDDQSEVAKAVAIRDPPALTGLRTTRRMSLHESSMTHGREATQ